ncbi:unnamed protein product [Auanema sp. JU1783]|nr:unnamed protein product [Auanema sp. JU1783]
MRPDTLSAYISLFYMIASGFNDQSLLTSILQDIFSEGRGNQKINLIILVSLLGCAVVSVVAVCGLAVLYVRRRCCQNSKAEHRPPKIKIIPVEK